jgi:hypothetical protein
LAEIEYLFGERMNSLILAFPYVGMAKHDFVEEIYEK